MIARRLGLIGAVALGLVTAHQAARASCTDYASSLRWLAGVEGDREPRDVATRDGIAFVLAYDDGQTTLEVLDLTDPSMPRHLADLALPGAPMDLALDGSRLLVAALDAGLLVIDVTDPAAPELAWVVPTPGEAGAVAVLGDLIVVADGSAGLTTITARAFGVPRVIASVATADRARGVAMLGERAVVADGSGGLLVVDVTAPASPAVRARVATPGYARDVAMRGTVACVADGTAGLSLYDLSDLDAPRFLATRPLTDRALRMEVAGSMAVVTDATGGAWLLDITDPADPVLWGRVGTAGSVHAAVLEGSRLYVADSLVRLQMYEVGDRVSDPLGRLDTGRESIRVACQGDLLVLGEASAITTVDIANVRQPIRRGSLAIPGWVHDLALFGDRVAAVDGSDLWLLSLTNPDQPKLLSRVPIKEGTPTGLAAAGDHLYVTAGWGNTQVFDVRRPQAPVWVAELETPGFNTDVVIDGHLAYVLDRHFGLYVFDVSDPARAEEIAILDVPVRSERASLADGRLCIAFRTLFGWPFGGLVVIDVSDPTRPRIVGQIYSPGAPLDVVATDQFVYLADGWTGVQVIELGALGQGRLDLRMLGRIAGSGPARGVTLGPDALLVAEGRAGLRTYVPQCGAATPVFLTEFSATHQIDRVIVRWSTAYPAPAVTFDLHRRLVGDDTDRPMNRLPIRLPQPFRYEDTDVVPGERYEYRLVATEDGIPRSYGPVVVSVPSRAALPVRVAPNPFTVSTRIVFDLPEAARATLEIFDSGGRLVRPLVVDLPLTAGRHGVEWDGRDGRGRSVSPGVYTYRLRAGSIFVRGKAIRRE